MTLYNSSQLPQLIGLQVEVFVSIFGYTQETGHLLYFCDCLLFRLLVWHDDYLSLEILMSLLFPGLTMYSSSSYTKFVGELGPEKRNASASRILHELVRSMQDGPPDNQRNRRRLCWKAKLLCLGCRQWLLGGWRVRDKGCTCSSPLQERWETRVDRGYNAQRVLHFRHWKSLELVKKVTSFIDENFSLALWYGLISHWTCLLSWVWTSFEFSFFFCLLCI